MSCYSFTSSSSDLESGLTSTQSKSSYTKFISSTGSPSPRSVTSMMFCDSFSDDEFHHFLDSCFLCHKNLKSNRDIFMYKGDTPFCSEECRQKQIELDHQIDHKNNNKKKKQCMKNKTASQAHF